MGKICDEWQSCKCVAGSECPHDTKQIEKALAERNEKISLLEAYSKFLEEHGYLDTDWRTEAPYAIDQFLAK